MRRYSNTARPRPDDQISTGRSWKATRNSPSRWAVMSGVILGTVVRVTARDGKGSSQWASCRPEDDVSSGEADIARASAIIAGRTVARALRPDDWRVSLRNRRRHHG